jgi:hypothetical protein
MKTIHLSFLLAVFALLSILLWAGSAKAQITGINAVGNSFATNDFIDQASFNPVPNGYGGDYFLGTGNNWNGSSATFAKTDPVTSDNSAVTFVAGYTATTYNVSLNNVAFSQHSGNTGSAYDAIGYDIQFQIGPSGLTTPPAIYPNLVVSGTLQTGGSASIQGNVYYYDSSYNLLDTVTYTWSTSTAGPFPSTPVPTTITSANLPSFAANTVLNVQGFWTINVDPGTLNVATVAPPRTLTGMHFVANGSFQFGFTNLPSAAFTVLCTTNLLVPLSQWKSLGTPVESPAGQYQFTDTAATNSARFYIVTSP